MLTGDQLGVLVVRILRRVAMCMLNVLRVNGSKVLAGGCLHNFRTTRVARSMPQTNGRVKLYLIHFLTVMLKKYVYQRSLLLGYILGKKTKWPVTEFTPLHLQLRSSQPYTSNNAPKGLLSNFLSRYIDNTYLPYPINSSCSTGLDF